MSAGKWTFIKGTLPHYTEPQNKHDCLEFAYKYGYIALKDIENNLVKDAEEHLEKSKQYLKQYKRRKK